MVEFPENHAGSGEAGSEGDDPTVVQDVGARVRRLRKVRGLSLAELSSRSGLSSGFLSQIERGISSGSVRAFAKIAEALDVTISDIFQSSEQKGGSYGITRAESRGKLEFPEALASKEMLTPFPFKPRLDVYILTMEPGGKSGEEPFSHKGIEAGYILEGGIELVVDGRKEILGVGDSFQFESTRPHSYCNAGQVTCRAVWINYSQD